MKKYLILIASLAVFTLISSGCYYDQILPPVPEQIVNQSISFSQDIIPIFDQSCNMAGCHIDGNTPPDLSAANAYVSLFNGSYINAISPESSELYQWMRGNRTTPMPLTGADSKINATVLAWIEQGAKNN